MEVLLPSTRPPGGAPTTAPDRSGAKPRRTFGPQPAPKSRPKPVRSAALRREEGGSTGRQVFAKEAWPPFRPLAARGVPVREAAGAGRLAPPAGGNRPRALAHHLGDLRFREAPSPAPKSSQGNQEGRQP